MDRFLEEVAAPTAAPGGGSAACHVGALSAALVEMCAGMAAQKGKQGAAEVVSQATALRERLARQTDLDAQAFEAVLTAYHLPKDDPGRKQAIGAALRGAAQSPLQVLDLLLQLSESIVRCEPFVPAGARSDWESSVIFARAAADVAEKNVLINLDGASGADELASELRATRAQLDQRLPKV